MDDIEFRYDTQLLIEGHDLDEDKINDYITKTSWAIACWRWGMTT